MRRMYETYAVQGILNEACIRPSPRLGQRDLQFPLEPYGTKAKEHKANTSKPTTQSESFGEV